MPRIPAPTLSAASLVLVLLLPAAGFGLPGVASDGPSASAVSGTWEILPMMPVHRTEVTSAAVGGDVYVIGGLAPDQNDGKRVDVFDTATQTWRRGPDLPMVLHHSQALTLGSRILLLGGYTPPGFTPVPFTWVLETAVPEAAQAWVPFVPLPEPRGAHGAATDGAAVYVYGGTTFGGHLASAWKMEGVLGAATVPAWVPIQGMPSPRDHLGGAWLDGKAYALAGRNGPNTARVDAYDPGTDTWTRVADAPTPRGGVVGAAAAGHVWVFGGEAGGGKTFDETEGYDPASDTWVSLPRMPHSRHGLGAAVIGDQVYVESGGPIAGLTYSGHNERLTLTR